METSDSDNACHSVDLEVGAGGAISPLWSVDDVSSAHGARAFTTEPRRHTVLTEYVLHTRQHTHTVRHVDTHTHTDKYT